MTSPAPGAAASVLVIEDDADIARAIQTLLTRAGYGSVVETDGRAGLRRFHTFGPDLVILDVGLPSLDGWTLLDRIRELSSVPVLMVTARDSENDKVRGLRGGADDYLTKPFGNQELLARVEAILRRVGESGRAYRDENGVGSSGHPAQLAGGGGHRFAYASPPAAEPGLGDGPPDGRKLATMASTARTAPGSGAGEPPHDSHVDYNEHRVLIDLRCHRVEVDGAPVSLTPNEFRLLEVLLRHRGSVLSTGQLLQLAWHDPTATGPDRVKFTVLRLRRKLGWSEGENGPLETVRGFGYRLRPRHP